MKKLIFFSLLSALSFSQKTQSFIEGNINTKSTFNNSFHYQDTDTDETLKGEIIVPNSGITFGAELQHRSQLSVFPYVLEPTGVFEKLEKNLDFMDSNAYIKFKKDNFNAKVKLNKNLKLGLDFDYQNYSLPNIEFGINTKSSFPLIKQRNYSPTYTTLKAFVQKDIWKLKDVRLDLETQHQIDKDTTSLGLQYFLASASARYTDIKDIKFYAEAKLKYQFANTYPIWDEIESVHVDCGHNHSHDNSSNSKKEEHDIFTHFHGFRQKSSETYEMAKDKKFIEQNKFAQSYILASKYTGIDNLELIGKVKFYHGDNSEKGKNSIYEIAGLASFVAKYTGIKNLTIKNELVGFIEKDKLESGVNFITKELKDTINVKYCHNFTDKLEFCPEGQTTLQLRGSSNHALFISPKVTLIYKPTNKFTFETSAEDKLAFSLNKSNKNYIELNNNIVSTKFKVKYSW